VSSASTTNISPEPPIFILDSFAVLAYLRGEDAGKRVRELLEQAGSGRCRIKFSTINLGEVVYIIERRYGLTRVQEILALLQQEPIEMVEADRTAILLAAHFKANYTLSYADAFVVAAAQTFSGTILTGDPEFQALESLVKIEWLVME
jgi:predicted nucleic acid-binding protein